MPRARGHHHHPHHPHLHSQADRPEPEQLARIFKYESLVPRPLWRPAWVRRLYPRGWIFKSRRGPATPGALVGAALFIFGLLLSALLSYIGASGAAR